MYSGSAVPVQDERSMNVRIFDRLKNSSNINGDEAIRAQEISMSMPTMSVINTPGDTSFGAASGYDTLYHRLVRNGEPSLLQPTRHFQYTLYTS